MFWQLDEGVNLKAPYAVGKRSSEADLPHAIGCTLSQPAAMLNNSKKVSPHPTPRVTAVHLNTPRNNC